MSKTLTALLAIAAFPFTVAAAQEPAKARLATIEASVAASGKLAGQAGPRSVTWIDGG